jgi:hypothetical protein
MNIEPGIYRPEFPMDSNFTMVPNALIRDEDITPSAKLLLIYLLSHKIGYQILDGQIIRETGLGRHALRTARKELEEAGFIELARIRNDDKSLGGYRYEMADPKGYFSTVESSTVAYSTVEDSTMENRPDNRKPIPKKTKVKKTTVENTGSIQEKFDQFWSIYPKKADKGLARRSFEKALNVTTIEVIIAGAERYRDDPNRDPEWTKNPSTWLNAESWDNEPEAPRSQKLTNAQKAAQLAMKYRAQAQQEQQAIETNIIDAEVVEEIASSWIKGVDEL